MDFAISTLNSDISFTALALDTVTGSDEMVQRVSIRLNTWFEEYYADLTYGVPYLERILGKNRSAQIIKSIFRRQISDIDGIDRVEDLAVSVDATDRIAYITGKAIVGDEIIAIDEAVGL